VKKLGKSVIVHLHDYQPISFNAVVFNGDERNYLRDVVKFEVLEHSGVLRAILAPSAGSINRLAGMWFSEADVVICVPRR